MIWRRNGAASVYNYSYDNVALGQEANLGLEYTFFPYTESTRRSVRFQYNLTGRHIDYSVKTIYGKEKETLLQQSLNTIVEMQQPWGELGVSFIASHYFHDFSKYNLSMGANVDWRIAKGLSLGLGGRVAYIRDQLSLPGGTLSTDEILLRQRQLATNYEYRTYVRLTYRFGSFINNIVNSRFNESYAGQNFYSF